MKVEFEGKQYVVKEVILSCVGGCGRKFGPFVFEKGTKAKIECLPCKIKRSAKR